MTHNRSMIFNQLTVELYSTVTSLGLAAALQAANIIREAVNRKGTANIILATGNSQLTFLKSLREIKDIPWPAVNGFHMDDYVHLIPGHNAGFPLTLRRNFFDHIQIGNFFPVPGWAEDLDNACLGYELLLRAHPADLCVMGIGENGHLAFNEPGIAQFNDPKWVRTTSLSEKSRWQQVNEGHFDKYEDVPNQAITLTIPALLSARHILVIVPDQRKAAAVQVALHGPISTDCPASILRNTPKAVLYLDSESASKIQ